MSQTKRATSHNRLLNYQPLLSEREFASSREWRGGGNESYEVSKNHSL